MANSHINKMRAFMVLLCISLVLASPQGYNYQIDVGSSEVASNAIPGISNQLENLQQYYSQQFQSQQQQLTQPQFVYQDQLAGQILPTRQTLSLEQNVGGVSDLQLGQNQFLSQNALQNIQFDQQQQQQQLTNEPQQQLTNVQEQQQQPLQSLVPPTTSFTEVPQQQFTEVNEQPKPTEQILDSQPQFIIQHRNEPQAQQISTAQSHASDAAKEKVVFQKEFYYLSAPQEDNETPKELQDQLNTIKKNLRVVFIKAPENNGLEKAALQLAQQSVNAQTAIYVLTKQHNAADLANKLQSLKSATPQRPEVAFIKYRTPEEAEHAQRIIQAQFEALEGPNHINRPTTAVSHDFTGSSSSTSSVDPRKSNSASAPSKNNEENIEKVGFTKPVSKYLPSSVRH